MRYLLNLILICFFCKSYAAVSSSGNMYLGSYDGSWKHGGKQLTRDEIQWIKENGWTPPPQG